MGTFVAFPRVREKSTTTGTGTLTLAGAVAGFQAFSVVGNASTVFYYIEAVTSNTDLTPTADWEEGKGTYTTSGTTLSRDTIIASSNSGAAVNFGAGTKVVGLSFASSQCNSFGAAGTGHYPGSVPDPGSSAHSPVYLLGDDALFHSLTGGGSLFFDNTTVAAGDSITSTSETAFVAPSNCIFNANTLAAGQVIRIRMSGLYSGTVLPTIRAKLKLAGAIILDTGAISGLATGTNLGWWAQTDMTVNSIGATGKLEAQGYAEFGTAATTGLSVNLTNTAALTVDTTANIALSVTIQWGAGGTGQTITMRQIIVEILTIQAAPGTVTNGANLGANKIVIGSDGVNAVKTLSTAAIDSSGNITGTNLSGTNTGDQLLTGGPMDNGTIVESHASNAATFAVKDAAGNDPSAGSPVKIYFYNATGGYDSISLTAATSIVVSSGSKLGALNATAFRVWLVGVNDGGTFRLGVINCSSIVNNASTGFNECSGIYPLRNHMTLTTTAEGGAGAADSAGVVYTGSAATTKQIVVLGYFDYASGLTTAGTWVTSPAPYRMAGRGVPLPGEEVQFVEVRDGAYSSTGTTVPYDNTIMQNTEGAQWFSQAITPTAVMNILDCEAFLNCGSSSGNQPVIGLFQDSTANSFGTAQSNQNAILVAVVKSKILAGTTSATTIKTRAGCGASGTFYFNGFAAAYLGGSFASFQCVREVMG